ncbi:MAG TPA: 50S ribosomal protein L11 methyltransferase [Gaiellaceae bacterium]|nr:50S ribosomal protein L11 methyltransferase [Gaiellaceae bacterium]
MVVGGEPELALLLHLFPEGVEELDGAYAVYAEEPPAGFDVVEVEDVAAGWEDAWRAFHHGARVGRCWVGPPWEAPPAGALAVAIEPGRAFGTGGHATTRLALELLQELEPASLLDVGCGSGVLAVAAAKLGFAPVTAVDLEPAAVEAARENARRNGVAVEVRLADALADELPAAEVAVANITLDAVEALLPRLAARRAVVSGYLERDEPRAAGWRPLARRACEGWAADLLERAP